MDPMTIVGMILVMVSTFLGLSMSGINPIGVFLDIPSIVIVVGGTIGATLAGGTIKDAMGGFKAALKAFLGGKGNDATEAVKQLLGFADTARRDGLLALESSVNEIEDDFVRRGLQLAVDGTDPEVVREILETEIDSLQARHKTGAGTFIAAAGYGPAFGVAGTVMGLIDMLGKLEDPSTLGPAMAVAFTTTLWGVFIANYICMPIAAKLKRASELEVGFRLMIIEGILSIQAGTNPRALSDKLSTYLAPSERAALEEKKSA